MARCVDLGTVDGVTVTLSTAPTVRPPIGMRDGHRGRIFDWDFGRVGR